MSKIKSNTKRGKNSIWRSILLWLFIGIVCAGLFEFGVKQFAHRQVKISFIDKSLKVKTTDITSASQCSNNMSESTAKSQVNSKENKQQKNNHVFTDDSVIRRLGKVADLKEVNSTPKNNPVNHQASKIADINRLDSEQILDRQLKVIDDLME